MRHNKEFTLIASNKEEPDIQQYHCKYHRSNRMIRLANGELRCSFCGSPEVAIRIVDTLEAKKA